MIFDVEDIVYCYARTYVDVPVSISMKNVLYVISCLAVAQLLLLLGYAEAYTPGMYRQPTVQPPSCTAWYIYSVYMSSCIALAAGMASNWLLPPRLVRKLQG